MRSIISVRMSSLRLLLGLLVLLCPHPNLMAADDEDWWGSDIRTAGRAYLLGELVGIVPILEKAVESARQYTFEDRDERLSERLTYLGSAYIGLCRFKEAEQALLESVSLLEGAQGEALDKFILGLRTLGELRFIEGRLDEAQVLVEKAMKLGVKEFGVRHPAVVHAIISLAGIFKASGRMRKSEAYFAMAIRYGEEGFRKGYRTETEKDYSKAALAIRTLNNMALLYIGMNRFGEAEKLLKKSLENQQGLGLVKDHPFFATTYGYLGSLYWVKGRWGDAEPLLKQAIEIREKAYGVDALRVGASLSHLASLYRTQLRPTDAHVLQSRALTIMEKACPPESSFVIGNLVKMAKIQLLQGHIDDAETSVARALSLIAGTDLSNPPLWLSGLFATLGRLRAEQGRYAEAAAALDKTRSILDRYRPPNKLDLAKLLSDRALIHRLRGDHEQARSLYDKALEDTERVLGDAHPSVAAILEEMAKLPASEGTTETRELLLKRVRDIRARALEVSIPVDKVSETTDTWDQ